MLTIFKHFEFEAAHRLPNYNGACQREHGHTYKLEIGVSGSVNPTTGMIADFKNLKDTVNDHILAHLDHQYINELDIIGVSENPTAENMVLWIVDVLQGYLKKTDCELTVVRLWETTGSWVEWKP